MNSSVFFMVILTVIATTRATVTNEDIRTAILQIVNVVRSTDDKLERHEYRDRVVGEQLKKGMINIDKRIKMLDPLKGTVGRLDERLAAVETILMQKNEREKMQLQRTYEAVIDIQKNLPVMMEELKNDILAKISTHEPPAQIIEPTISKEDFKKMEKEVVGKIDRVTNSINNLENELVKIKDDSKQLRDLNDKSSENLEKLKRHINDNQQLLTKYDKKLAEYNNKIPEISNSHSKEQDEWKQNVLKALDGQKTNVKEIVMDLKNLQNKINQLPQKDDINSYQRQSPSSADLRQAINDVNENLNSTHDDTMKNLSGLTEITAILVKSVANTNNELDGQKVDVKHIQKEIQNLQDRINQLPQKDDLNTVQRTTFRKLDEVANGLNQNPQNDEIRRTLSDINNNLNRWQADIVRNLSEIAKNLSKNTGSNDQSPDIREIVQNVRNLQNQVSQLPQKYDLDTAQNATLNKLEEIGRSAPILEELRRELDQANNNFNKTHEDTMRNLNDLSEITGTLAENFAKNYGKIRSDIQALSKVDQVMIKTADDVIDTKRRVEYGVHQILGELGKQIKESSKNINQGLSDRFDIFESTILDEETGAIANLTSKIGEDIHQVWRQIGIMYQQISNSADTLNHLQNITDTYVNGSLGAMDNMKGKVGQITGRMTEVDENLNYLLGRLSLVTQEFNQIKTGLGSALDQIRDSFHAVEDKIKDNGKVKDNGPGPHKIPPSKIPPTK